MKVIIPDGTPWWKVARALAVFTNSGERPIHLGINYRGPVGGPWSISVEEHEKHMSVTLVLPVKFDQ
jgi:hypothetical protein